jgi:UDP-glucose 4-epimerase
MNRRESIDGWGRRVLVTGGAGFIGAHVAAALLDEGRHVEVLDNLSVGSLERVPAGVRFHLADVRSESDLARVFGGSRFDAVVHCAAQTSVERSMMEPELDAEINVRGTELLAGAAKATGVERIVFASSGGAIYGETSKPAIEETPPAPRSHYGRHKYEAERALFDSGVPSVALRFSNVYGPGQRADAEGGVVAIFLERLAAGEPLELHGGGKQVRDFVHVSDVVRAALLALGDGMSGVWNVASGRATSIIELVEEMAALVNRTVQVRRMPRRDGDVKRSLIDPAKLLATGAWGPPLPLAEGLRQTAAASGIVLVARKATALDAAGASTS